MRSALEKDDRKLTRNAQKVRKAGRGGDSILIHINPEESSALEGMWGEPSTNPHTGLPEYGFFSKMKKALKFELSHMKKVTKEIIKNPKRTLTGPTPLGTKANNWIFGEKKKPLTGQLGGATPEEHAAYEEKHGEGSLGYAPKLNAAANMIAGWYAGGAAGNLAGSAAGKGAAALGANGTVQAGVKAVGARAGSMAANAGVAKLNEDGMPSETEYYPGSSALATNGATYSGGGVPKVSKKQATSLLLGRAAQIADRPYTPYEGERVAGMSENERRASALARTPNDGSMRNLDKAESAIDDSLKEFNSENLESYLSPFRDSGIAKQNEEFDRQSAALANSKAGAWGGDRAAFAQSELSRQHMGSLMDINAQAYRDATNTFFADADRKQRAADSYRAVGGDISRMRRDQIQDLMATGGLERVLNQAELDFDYQQFAEARDWDITNLGPLLAALGTTGQPGANPKGDNTAAAIGAAATLAGAYFSANPGGGTAAPAASSASTPVFNPGTSGTGPA